MKLIGYFDESGTQSGASVLTIGGCIARAEAWQAFGVEWQQAMRDYGLSGFHMNTFENRRGPFASWSNHRRIHRLNRLMTIINRNVIATAGMSVDKKIYEETFPPELKERVRGAYGLALKGCLASLKRLHKTTKIPSRFGLSLLLELTAPVRSNARPWR